MVLKDLRKYSNVNILYLLIMTYINTLFHELEEYIIRIIIPFQIKSFGILYIIIGLIQYIIYLFLIILLINVIYKIRENKYWVSWVKISNDLKILSCFLFSPIMFTFFSIFVFIFECLSGYNILSLIINLNLASSFVLLILLILFTFLPYYFILPIFMKIFLVENMNEDEYGLFGILLDLELKINKKFKL